MKHYTVKLEVKVTAKTKKEALGSAVRIVNEMHKQGALAYELVDENGGTEARVVGSDYNK